MVVNSLTVFPTYLDPCLTHIQVQFGCFCEVLWFFLKISEIFVHGAHLFQKLCFFFLIDWAPTWYVEIFHIFLPQFEIAYSRWMYLCICRICSNWTDVQSVAVVVPQQGPSAEDCTFWSVCAFRKFWIFHRCLHVNTITLSVLGLFQHESYDSDYFIFLLVFSIERCCFLPVSIQVQIEGSQQGDSYMLMNVPKSYTSLRWLSLLTKSSQWAICCCSIFLSVHP